MSLSNDERMKILQQRMDENVSQREALREEWNHIYTQWYECWVIEQNELMEAWEK